MGPKRRLSTPEDVARVEEIRRAYDEQHPEGVDVGHERRPGLRGKVVEPEPADQDGTEGRVGRS